ncbi:MAG TPA: molybdenum ABC transporter ATP-binding protein [Pseudomonadales bacterium]|nr:molybdenum ABC transporter ATP-binding protein [Pseudomonadales bacterium]
MVNVLRARLLHRYEKLTPDRFTLDCDISLPMQGFTVISGRSGCGKTTLLRCIAGLTRSEGEVHFREQCWQGAKKFLPVYQRPLAYVFQQPALFPHMDVRGNLQFALDRVKPDARKIVFDDVVSWLELGNFLTHKPSQLSGGQQQRVAIARALLASPQLLLMDEPLASLDVDSKAEILPYLERLHTQLSIPVLYVTHSMDELARLADQLVLLENGKVRAVGDVHELLTRPDLPLAHLDDAAAVLEASILQHDEHYHLSQVSVEGGSLTVALSTLAVGSKTRVRILARDVSITLQPIERSSIQNSLRVRIAEIGPDKDAARVLVRLELGSSCILARITRRASDQLALEVGQSVYAHIKTVALIS